MIINDDTINDLTILRDHSQSNLTRLHAALRLNLAGAFEAIDKADSWLPMPAEATGRQVRQRKISGGVRVGGAHAYEITAETDDWIIVRTWAADGSRHYGEEVYPRAGFVSKFERKPRP